MNIPPEKYTALYTNFEGRMTRIMDANPPIFLLNPRDSPAREVPTRDAHSRDAHIRDTHIRDAQSLEWVNSVYAGLCKHHSIMNCWTPPVLVSFITASVTPVVTPIVTPASNQTDTHISAK